MSKLNGGIVIASAWFMAGMTVRAIYDQRNLKLVRKERYRYHKLYNREVRRSNRLTKRINDMTVDLANCRHLNYQVAGYAMTLQKQIDEANK